MSANLDGYNTPKDGIHKTEMLKRIDKLEEGMRQLVAVLALMNQTLEQLEDKNNVER
jgi:hypothetical protein